MNLLLLLRLGLRVVKAAATIITQPLLLGTWWGRGGEGGVRETPNLGAHRGGQAGSVTHANHHSHLF